jgi:hypothetical protein
MFFLTLANMVYGSSFQKKVGENPWSTPMSDHLEVVVSPILNDIVREKYKEALNNRTDIDLSIFAEESRAGIAFVYDILNGLSEESNQQIKDTWLGTGVWPTRGSSVDLDVIHNNFLKKNTIQRIATLEISDPKSIETFRNAQLENFRKLFGNTESEAELTVRNQ